MVVPQMRVTAHDPVYRRKARLEAEYWSHSDFSFTLLDTVDAGRRAGNAAYTGNPEKSWLEDVIARGPFHDAAVLGCNEAAHEDTWLGAGASKRLDIYELSRGVIRKVQTRLKLRRLGIAWPKRRVRFIAADLNFARLPRNRYDVIWTCGCVHHIINLEHLFAQVESALRDDGLFALNDYVGERRLQYELERLQIVNDVLREIPMRFRKGGIQTIVAPQPEEMSPFCAVRSDEILEIAQARFEILHLAFASALFPLPLFLDFHAMEKEAPELIEHLVRSEEDARRTLRPCGVYAVFRKRKTSLTGSKVRKLRLTA